MAAPTAASSSASSSSSSSALLPVPKLTDFGVSRDLPDSSRSNDLTAETGTYRWMAPEVLRHEQYSESADVYSWSLVVYETITHGVPFKGYESIQAASKVALENRRPSLPEGLPKPVAQLIIFGWSSVVAARPSASRLVEMLDSLSGQLAGEVTGEVTGEAGLTEEDMAWLDDPSGHPAPALDGPADGVADLLHRPRSRSNSASSPALSQPARPGSASRALQQRSPQQKRSSSARARGGSPPSPRGAQGGAGGDRAEHHSSKLGGGAMSPFDPASLNAPTPSAPIEVPLTPSSAEIARAPATARATHAAPGSPALLAATSEGGGPLPSSKPAWAPSLARTFSSFLGIRSYAAPGR